MDMNDEILKLQFRVEDLKSRLETADRRIAELEHKVPITDDELDEVRLSRFDEYLLNTGWERWKPADKTKPYKGMYVSNDRLVLMSLPGTELAADYPIYIRSAISIVAERNGLSPREILKMLTWQQGE